MKNIKKLFLLGLGLFLSVSLVSCGDDSNDTETGGSKNINILNTSLDATSTYQDFNKTINDIEFSFHKVKVDSEGIYFTNGSYVTNLNPLDYFTSMFIEYDKETDDGYLKYKYDNVTIDAANEGGNKVDYSGAQLNINGTNSTNGYFSLYSVAGDFKITSIGLDYKDGTYQDSTNNVVDLDFYGTNDFHGKIIEDTDYSYPGISKHAEIISEAIDNNKEGVTFIGSGDLWQGTAYSNLNYGRLLTEAYSICGLDCYTIGNHEFDWGLNNIVNQSKNASFPFLAINIIDEVTQKRVEGFDASTIVTRNGVKIGIIGAIGDCYNSIDYLKTLGYRFAVDDELTSLIKDESDSLRKQGCSIVMLSLHDGGIDVASDEQVSAYYDLSLSQNSTLFPNNKYIDFSFEAHTHSKYIYTDKYGTIHMQNESDGKELVELKLSFDKTTDKYTLKSAKNISTEDIMATSSNKEVYEYVNEYTTEEDEVVGEVITKNSPGFDEEDIKTMQATGYYEELKEQALALDPKYDIVMSGVQTNPRSPRSLPYGEVTFGDTYNVLCFTNQILICSLEGKYIKSFFINQPTYYQHYPDVSSDALEDDKIYYIVTDSWTLGKYYQYQDENSINIEKQFYDENDAEIYPYDIANSYLAKYNNMEKNTITFDTTETYTNDLYVRGLFTEWKAEKLTRVDEDTYSYSGIFNVDQNYSYQISTSEDFSDANVINECKTTLNHYLSYTYLGGGTSYISEPPATAIVTIAEAFETKTGRSVITTGTIIGKGNGSYLVKDDTATILIYSKTFATTYKVGDYVRVTGIIGSYNNYTQIVIDEDTDIVQIDTGIDYDIGEPEEFTYDKLSSFINSKDQYPGRYISVDLTFKLMNGKYYDGFINDSSDNYYICVYGEFTTDFDKTAVLDKKVHLEGFLCGQYGRGAFMMLNKPATIIS
ncbi:MAG: hypothetical protein WCR97_04450 [Bacilli bacterium]